MRAIVDKILSNEATRLYEVSVDKGLDEKSLTYLNQLISTYQNFVGSSSEEEAAPEAQDTATLLEAIKQNEETNPTRGKQK